MALYICLFYCMSIYEGGLGSRNSVRPSVCLLHAWIVTKLNDTLWLFWYHRKGQSLCYSDTNSGWWAMLPSLWNLWKWPTPFEKRRLRPISAYNVSTVRGSKRRSIVTNIKSTMGFPTSYRWSAYITHKSRRVAQKAIFFTTLFDEFALANYRIDPLIVRRVEVTHKKFN